MNEFHQIAQRIVNAEEGFIEIIQEKGFTRDEAIKFMQAVLRLKLAKLDPVLGRINVKHGALLESKVIRGFVDAAVGSDGGREATGAPRVAGDSTEVL